MQDLKYVEWRGEPVYAEIFERLDGIQCGDSIIVEDPVPGRRALFTQRLLLAMSRRSERPYKISVRRTEDGRARVTKIGVVRDGQ